MPHPPGRLKLERQVRTSANCLLTPRKGNARTLSGNMQRCSCFANIWRVAQNLNGITIWPNHSTLGYTGKRNETYIHTKTSTLMFIQQHDSQWSKTEIAPCPWANREIKHTTEYFLTIKWMSPWCMIQCVWKHAK